MNRRQVIIGIGSTLAVGATTGTWLFLDTWWFEKNPTRLREALSIYTRALQGLDLLGLKYLEQAKRPNGTLSLSNAIIASLPNVNAETLLTAEEVARLIGERISQDFRDSRLCNVEGWRLSTTECTLAALHVRLANITEADIAAAPGFATAKKEQFLDITNWGPKGTAYNVPFNVQADGHSGMWFSVGSPPPRSLEVFIDGESVPTTVQDDVFTIGIYGAQRDRMVATPGDYEIYAYDEVRHVKQKVGDFRVSEKPDYATLMDGSKSTVFCPVEAWGPQSTPVGKPFNVQPDGSSAFWVHIDCAPHNAILRLGNLNLDTTVHQELVTATFKNTAVLKNAGEKPLMLYHPDTGEALLVGSFSVHPNVWQ